MKVAPTAVTAAQALERPTTALDFWRAVGGDRGYVPFERNSICAGSPIHKINFNDFSFYDNNIIRPEYIIDAKNKASSRRAGKKQKNSCALTFLHCV